MTNICAARVRRAVEPNLEGARQPRASLTVDAMGEGPMAEREHRRPFIAADMPLDAAAGARPTLSPAFASEAELRAWGAANPAPWGAVRTVFDGRAALALIQHRERRTG
jgi:hypothetical protein